MADVTIHDLPSGVPVSSDFLACDILMMAVYATRRITLAQVLAAGLPDQSGHGGDYLTTDGAALSWGPVSPGGVTSVGSGDGLTGGTITTTGTLSVVGVDSVTADGAGVHLVNDSAGPSASNYYGTDAGAVLGYHALPAAGGPGGSGTDVQINDGSGGFAGFTAFTYDSIGQTLSVGSTFSVELGNHAGSGPSAVFRDGTNTVSIADGTRAISTSTGNIQVIGGVGSTFEWNGVGGSPTPVVVAAWPGNAYGSSLPTAALVDPDAWLRVEVSGTHYVIPAYLA